MLRTICISSIILANAATAGCTTPREDLDAFCARLEKLTDAQLAEIRKGRRSVLGVYEMKSFEMRNVIDAIATTDARFKYALLVSNAAHVDYPDWRCPALEKIWVPARPEAADQIESRSYCEDGIERNDNDAAHCYYLGNSYLKGETAFGRDPFLAAKYFDIGCRTGSADACIGAARLYRPIDAERARAYRDAACANGNELYCINQDVTCKTKKACAAACKRGDGDACLHAAGDPDALKDGRAIVKAMMYGSPAAMRAFAQLLQDELEADQRKQALRMACKNGDVRGCAVLAELTPDEGKYSGKRRYHEKACFGGWTDSCSKMENKEPFNWVDPNIFQCWFGDDNACGTILFPFGGEYLALHEAMAPHLREAICPRLAAKGHRGYKCDKKEKGTWAPAPPLPPLPKPKGPLLERATIKESIVAQRPNPEDPLGNPTVIELEVGTSVRLHRAYPEMVLIDTEKGLFRVPATMLNLAGVEDVAAEAIKALMFIDSMKKSSR